MYIAGIEWWGAIERKYQGTRDLMKELETQITNYRGKGDKYKRKKVK